MKTKNILLMAVAVAVIPACTFGPKWSRVKPNPEVPAAFRGASVGDSTLADMPWQSVLNDSNLKALLNDVFRSNHSIAALQHNVDAARRYVTVASAPLFPWVGYGASTSKGMNQSGGAGIAQMGGQTSNPGSIMASASWELDIWGKTRKEVESAKASAEAANEQLNNLRVSLMKEVSCAYLQLILLDEQLRIAKESVKSYSESLELFSNRQDAGVADKLQTSSAEAALAASEAQIPQLESQITALENTISTLAGRMPGHIARSSKLPDFAAASSVPAGIPADVLSRRPDIRAKEQSLRAANADIGAAIASYFPSISLTGAAGYASADLRHDIPFRRTGWGIGANLSGPIFRAGQLRANEKIKRDAFLAAKAEYEETVITAISEVSSTLVSRAKLKEVMDKQAKAVAAYQESLALARDRYKEGYSSYYEVLTAQQGLFPAQMQLSNYQYQYAACVPTLYAQLGGGWRDLASYSQPQERQAAQPEEGALYTTEE